MNQKEYLDFIRQRNKEIMSKCHYCDGFAITITAEKHLIYPVCKNHMSIKDLESIENNINKIFEDQKDFE